MITFFIFLFGLIVGSFLNVVILRFHTGKSLGGRSGCFSCRSGLRWFELVPVLSYLFQRGHCRHCYSKISWQYPLVELLTGSLFVLTYLHFAQELVYLSLLPIILFGITLIIIGILVVILAYDIRHFIIPDELSFLFAVFGLVTLLITSYETGYLTLEFGLNLLAGPLLLLPFYLLWKVSDGKWIGLGDGKLAVGIGWWLGLTHGLSAVVLAFWIGAIFSLVLLLITHLKKRFTKLTMKTAIPFAPFLILGTLIVFFTDIQVMDIIAYIMYS